MIWKTKLKRSGRRIICYKKGEQLVQYQTDFLQPLFANNASKKTVMEIVIVQLDGSSRTLVVGPQSTVADLKSLIESTLKVPVHLQKLVFVNGIKTPLSDDSKPLSFYGLVSGSHVSLLVTERNTIQVFLRKEKGTSTYEVTPDETVDTFKEKVHRREKIQVTQQCLTHNSKVMTEGKLSDYGVKENSTIELNLRLRGG